MQRENAIKQKVRELSEALKTEGLWKHEPKWVNIYRDGAEVGGTDFFEWLQFIYLPNLLLDESSKFFTPKRNYIAPQAMPYFEKEVNRSRLLQLMVELDSLTE